MGEIHFEFDGNTYSFTTKGVQYVDRILALRKQGYTDADIAAVMEMDAEELQLMMYFASDMIAFMESDNGH